MIGDKDEDEVDTFQIKPLTDGLGFHKKAVRLGEKVHRANLSEDILQKPIPTKPPQTFFSSVGDSQNAKKSLDQLVAQLNLGDERINKAARTLYSESNESEAINSHRDDVEISPTLPRYAHQDIFAPVVPPSLESSSVGAGVPDLTLPSIHQQPTNRQARQTPSRPVVKGILPISPSVKVRQSLDTAVNRSAHDAKRGSLTPASISLSSIILDFIVCVALGLVFLVSLLSVTKVEVLSVAFNIRSDGATQLSLLILFVAVVQMYVVVARSFFGRTLGEWTFDYQMGDDQQHRSGLYPLLVAWRSFLILLTGVVTLPLLSLLFNRDLTARLSGLQLYRRP